MGHLIDLDDWPRRATWEFFLGFEDPWFNLTAEIDVSATREWCRDSGASFSLACWFAVAQACMEVPSLRQRLRQGGVWQHDELRVGATVLKDDESFVYVYFPSADDFATFEAEAGDEMDRRLTARALEPHSDDDDLLYCTTIPWVRFTGIKHARQGGGLDSVPRIAVGRATDTPEGCMMPISVEAHHALVDGLHIGQFLEELEALLASPEDTFCDPSD